MCLINTLPPPLPPAHTHHFSSQDDTFLQPTFPAKNYSTWIITSSSIFSYQWKQSLTWVTVGMGGSSVSGMQEIYMACISTKYASWIRQLICKDTEVTKYFTALNLKPSLSTKKCYDTSDVKPPTLPYKLRKNLRRGLFIFPHQIYQKFGEHGKIPPSMKYFT